MVKSILAIIAGIIGGGIIIYLLEMLGHSIYPPPEGIDMTNPESINEYIKTDPIGSLIFVLIGWAMGTMTAGFLASMIASKSKITHAIIVSSIFLIFGIINMVMIPPPVWFGIIGILIYIPFGYLGGKLGLGFWKKQAQS